MPAAIYAWHATTIGIPLWIPFLIVARPILILIRRDRRRYQRGVCSSCGYNLAGNVSGACPECGMAVPEQAKDQTPR